VVEVSFTGLYATYILVPFIVSMLGPKFPVIGTFETLNFSK
jgi:hypothetical protein